MEKKIGIYQISNQINNHSYIGQSRDIYKRWNSHRSITYNSNAEGYNLPLYRAIRKYGIDNFSFDIIEECKIEELDTREQYWIQKIKPEYNLSLGGQNGGKNSQLLTLQQVEEIQTLLIQDIEGKISHQELAKKYNVLAEGAIRDINVGRSWYNPNFIYPLHQPNQRTHYYCCDCGTEISSKAIRCEKCNKLFQRRVIRPTRETLKQKIRTTSFTALGKEYGVTDNSIRKWCKCYNLPSKKSEIRNISDDDWNNL